MVWGSIFTQVFLSFSLSGFRLWLTHNTGRSDRLWRRSWTCSWVRRRFAWNENWVNTSCYSIEGTSNYPWKCVHLATHTHKLPTAVHTNKPTCRPKKYEKITFFLRVKKKQKSRGKKLLTQIHLQYTSIPDIKKQT